MLELRPSCECCDTPLPPDSTAARICSFECTFCAACADGVLAGRCPNCGGELLPRPRRPAEKLAANPASERRILKPGGCVADAQPHVAEQATASASEAASSVALHHLSLGVRDIARAARFYDAVLAPLGICRVWSDLRAEATEQAVGYGRAGGGDALALKQVAACVPEVPGFHLAFPAASPAEVEAFHAAALAAGGSDNGAPGLRPHYGAGYFAAFVIDPDGYRLEAVCNSNTN